MEITKERYLELLKFEEVLSRLERGGVDNWDFYGDSLYPEGEPSIDEIMEEHQKNLENQ